MFGEGVAQELEGVFGGVDEFEEVEIFGGDGAGVDEGLEVHDAVPVFTAVNYDKDFFCEFVGLGEGENFEEFVDSAEAAGKNHQGFSEIGEPKLAHEEIMEFEIERWSDVGVRILLEGQIDVKADTFASGFVSAEVGGFHDAGASAGGDDEAAAASGNLNGPLGEQEGEAAGVFVVAGHLNGGKGALKFLLLVGGRGFGVSFFGEAQVFAGGVGALEAGGAEKNDGVLNLLAAKACEGFLIF